MRENLYEYINSVNWDDIAFNEKKAYVCAKFSELIYEYKPKNLSDRTSFYEINDSTLAKYENIRKFNSSLRNYDMSLLFIAETKDSITIGISVFRVVIVASRGTAVKKDWQINLKFLKTRACKLYKLNFHAGFHKIALKTLTKIHERLARENVPIYFTGHSLGGALAGILYFYFSSKCNCKGNFAILRRNSLCAYTFGMPKFSNFDHETFENMYHIYNPIDGVPATPPQFLGYVQNGKQYELSDNGLLRVDNKKFISFKNFMAIVMRGKIIKEHAMEKYLFMLQKLIKT